VLTACAAAAGRLVGCPWTPTATRPTGSPCRPASSTSAGEGDKQHLHRTGAAGGHRRMYAVYHGPDGLRRSPAGCTARPWPWRRRCAPWAPRGVFGLLRHGPGPRDAGRRGSGGGAGPAGRLQRVPGGPGHGAGRLRRDDNRRPRAAGRGRADRPPGGEVVRPTAARRSRRACGALRPTSPTRSSTSTGARRPCSATCGGWPTSTSRWTGR
jgi:hypothetical protein